LATRGRLTGNKPLTDEYVKSVTKYADIAELAAAIVNGEIRMKDVPELKPVLRMHPPRKGYKTTKRTYNQGGALGYYGAEINDLLIKMR
ncbi:MAG TPA: 50S ribosomal protein L30, partial [Methanocorpusculum sp.]|nr:50S ribosomal protein L30 [Methanocorpusculum sp.]